MTDTSLDEFATRKLAALAARGLRRELRETDRRAGQRVIDGGRELVSFACNDYLGLTRDPAVIAASLEATQRHGAGAGASRLVSGNHPLYASLERRIATLKGADDAVVFGSGYLASIGVLTTLAAKPDLILIDELAHSCLHAGAVLSGARVATFRHNDTDALEAKIVRHRHRCRHCLIVSEGVFSMDGDLAPLPALAAVAQQHDAWLVIDDAHALGVIGDGRGSRHAHGTPVPVHVQLGTLSKAVGAYGGYAAVSRQVAAWLRSRARSLIYSTGLPPGTVAAASAGLDIIATDPIRVARPLELARRFTAGAGLSPAASAIVPIIVGAPALAVDMSRELAERGLLVVAIRPPTVPAGTSRLRLTFSAAHRESDVDALAAAVNGLRSATS